MRKVKGSVVGAWRGGGYTQKCLNVYLIGVLEQAFDILMDLLVCNLKLLVAAQFSVLYERLQAENSMSILLDF